MESWNAFISLLNEMSPYLLLGFLFAGLLHVYVPRGIYMRYLSQNDFRSVLWAALFGIPLPLCSCGVIPTAMSLRNEGASKGATTSFLIATPQTGVDSIMATYSLLGLPFAVIRPFVALVTAFVGGMAVNRFAAGSEKESNGSSPSPCETGCSNNNNSSRPRRSNRLIEALRYGYVEMLQDIGKWLVIGLVIAGLITVFVPTTFFEQYADTPIKNMLLVLLFSVPMYLCATGSIPIAAALMLKGMSPGAALVLLMAGPATNMAAILVIRKVMGAKTLITYLAAIMIGAVGFGLVIDYLLPAEWFAAPLTVTAAACCQPDTPWFKTSCSILLVLLLVYAFFLKYKQKPVQINDMTAKYKITGMSCNHCKESVEKGLGKLAGVTYVSVDLNSGTAFVEGTATEAEVKVVIDDLGFGYGGKA